MSPSSSNGYGRAQQKANRITVSIVGELEVGGTREKVAFHTSWGDVILTPKVFVMFKEGQKKTNLLSANFRLAIYCDLLYA